MTETEKVSAARSEQPHAQRIQILALTLFDHTGAAHRLPAQNRRLLQLAAACYNAARQSDAARPDRAGRDLVLAASIPDLTADDQAIVACVVAFQRSKVRPHREPAFLRLGKKDQQTALGLAAILWLAAALDVEPAYGLRIQVDGGATTLIVDGERAAEVASGAHERADLWRDRIGTLTVRVAELNEFDSAEGTADGHEAAPALDLVLTVPVAPDHASGGEPLAEAARRQLRRFFDKLLAREDAVRDDDEDAEDVHQMRVATRRLRASLQVVAGVYDPMLIRRYRRGLRRLAQSLGTVRDGDVFEEHVIAYRDARPQDERAGLEPLIVAVATERAQARQALLDDLDSKRYGKLKREFAAFLTTPGAGVLDPPEPGIRERVRDFAGSAIWRRYEQWRAYEVALPNATNQALHQARIAGKRLRYTLDFFAEALGPQVEQALNPLIALQDNLGALHDGVVARAHVAALGLADDPGAQAYLAASDAEHDAHLAEMPRRWEKVGSATYLRRLFELLVKL